jgi:16S rRNA C1402 (ribose-2'-O) methylase RsmI
VARELTKLYQETPLLKLSKMIKYYQSRKIKGEIVLLISGDPNISDTNL